MRKKISILLEKNSSLLFGKDAEKMTKVLSILIAVYIAIMIVASLIFK